MEVITKDFVKSILPNRSDNADKFAIGTQLSICGSYGMAGAGIMSAKASLRSGVGLLRMIIPNSIYSIMAASVFEPVYCPVEENNPKSNSFIKRLNNNNSILIGCGLSTSNYGVSLLNKVIEISKIPTVIDADGLNILSKNISLLDKINAPVVLTPHLVEMSRLTGLSVDEINSNKEKTATDFAKAHNCVVVLKGHNTIVASPNGNAMINTEAGNSGMATGGSGDVLAGIIAALIAQGMDSFNGACAGVYIHALAGDITAEKFTKASMLPTDMIEAIPQAFKEIKGTI